MNMMTRGKIPLRCIVREEITNTDKHSPRYHSDPEANKGTGAQTGDSTNKYLNGASEDQTYSVMHWKPFSHGLAESNSERQVGEVDKHRQHGCIGRGRFACLVL